MMCGTIEIINMSNKYRNNHYMRTSLVHCPIENNADISLRIEIYGSNMDCINDIYNYFATLQARYGQNEYIDGT